MLRGLYTAYTGMMNEQHRMDTLSNNLANADTVGFKKEGTTQQAFDKLMMYRIKDETDGVDAAEIGSISLGVKIGENYTDYTQGSFRVTEGAYDLAISGDGFFTVDVLNADGTSSVKYTRDGAFTINKDGYMVTDEGNYLLGVDGNRIQIDPNAETAIDHDGILYQNERPIAQIMITDFEDYNYLEKYGNNFLYPVEGATTKPFEGSIYQGYLEMSNVQVVSEMVDMITISRAYESNQKLIQTMDSTLEIAVSQVGRV